MKNLEQYKDRFYNLMESTMGNVKPLINEAVDLGITEPTAKQFMDQVGDIITKQGAQFIILKQTSCYNGHPTIYKGQPNHHFYVLYNPNSNAIVWQGFQMANGKLISSTQLPHGAYQIKKDDKGKLEPESQKKMQEAINIIKGINFKGAPFDNSIADFAACTQPQQPSPKQPLKK